MIIDTRRVRELATVKLWTQQDLAEASGVSRATVSNVLRSGTGAKTTVIKLASALDVEPEELVKTG